jgi:hypothetical protein
VRKDYKRDKDWHGIFLLSSTGHCTNSWSILYGQKFMPLHIYKYIYIAILVRRFSYLYASLPVAISWSDCTGPYNHILGLECTCTVHTHRLVTCRLLAQNRHPHPHPSHSIYIYYLLLQNPSNMSLIVRIAATHLIRTSGKIFAGNRQHNNPIQWLIHS